MNFLITKNIKNKLIDTFECVICHITKYIISGRNFFDT